MIIYLNASGLSIILELIEPACDTENAGRLTG